MERNDGRISSPDLARKRLPLGDVLLTEALIWVAKHLVKKNGRGASREHRRPGKGFDQRGIHQPLQLLLQHSALRQLRRADTGAAAASIQSKL